MYFLILPSMNTTQKNIFKKMLNAFNQFKLREKKFLKNHPASPAPEKNNILFDTFYLNLLVFWQI